jgi:uncharacterized protein (DUF427 family)
MKAIWKNVVLADSNDTTVVEGNHYFPPEAVHREHLQESTTHTTCSWKGQTSYYHIVVNGERHQDAAWYYPDPKVAAKHIQNYVAFWKGVAVVP